MDARVSLIEVTCVRLAMHMGQEAIGDVALEAEQVAQPPTGTLWEQVDSFTLEDVFLRRVPMLKTCPHFMRGRLRECFQMALTERYRAKMESDEERGNCLRWCPPCCFTDREGLELLAGVNCLSERRSSPGDIGGR